MNELLEALQKHKIEIYVDGLKEDEIYLSDGALSFLFENIDDICFNDGADDGI